MKKGGFIAILLVASLGIAAYFFVFSNDRSKQKNIMPEVRSITGTIEAEDMDINVKVPGKVEKIYVEEGQDIKKGQAIVKLEAENIDAKVRQAKAMVEITTAKVHQAETAYKAQKEQSESQINQAKAVLEAATAQLNKAKAGARPQLVEQAKELVAQAQKGYELAKSTYERFEQLYKEGLLPQQKIDMAKTDMEVAMAKYNTAAQQYDLVKEGAQKEDIQSAEALVNQAQATVNLANTSKLSISVREQDIEAAKAQQLQAKAALDEAVSYLKDTTIRSPVAGVITMRSVDDGEMVSTGMPVVTITNLKNMWVNLRVKESDLNKFKLSQNIKLKVIGVPGKNYIGKVSFIALKPSYATERATPERGDKDLISFLVKIKLNNSDFQLRPGMTAVIDDIDNAEISIEP